MLEDAADGQEVDWGPRTSKRICQSILPVVGRSHGRRSSLVDERRQVAVPACEVTSAARRR